MKKIIFICLFFLLATNVVFGQGNLKVSLPLMPPAVVNENEGTFIDLLKAMNEEYKGGKIEIIGIFPFARSIANVVDGKADFHIPILKVLPEKAGKLNYLESTEVLFTTAWVLYANKDVKGLNADTVSKFKICTDRGNIENFNFNIQPVNDIETGLKMVSAGRFDGFIYAMPPTDMFLKKSDLKNIKRIFYKTVTSVMLIQKNERGKEVDKILSNIIKSLKAKGIYQKIMRPPFIGMKFEEWQVY